MANGNDIASLVASLTQLVPFFKRVNDGIKFLFDQPITRQPYYLPTSAPGGQTIAAGAQNVPLLLTDFSHSLSWPFEVHKIKVSLDPAHTLRDASVVLKDQTFNQEWFKNPAMLDGLVENNTGFWSFEPFPWIIRPEGGGQQFNIDNLDAINPIQVALTLHGYLLIPQSRER